jgi:serine O-acetyltransferase
MSKSDLLSALQKEFWGLRLPVGMKVRIRRIRGPHDGNRLLVTWRAAQYYQAIGKHRLAAKLITYIRQNFGCYISLSAEIGEGTRFPHPVGIVIGDGVRIGAGCTIFQHVTCGGARLGDWEASKYPDIGAGTTIFAGACLIGSITIGDQALIGANAVVRRDVPARALAAGVPAVIRRQMVDGSSLDTLEGSGTPHRARSHKLC